MNVCSPNAATNADFTAALAAALCRPAVVPMPEFAVRAVFGEMGEEILLGSQKAVPKKLLGSGFVFKRADIYDACREAVA